MFDFVPFDFGRNGWMRRMEREFDAMNKMFEGFGGGRNMCCDVEDLGDRYEIVMELPGMKKEDISLKVSDNVLVISAEQKSESKTEDTPEIKAEPAEAGQEKALAERKEQLPSQERRYIHRERRYQSMERRFNVEEIEVKKITANYENGLLTVVLPKKTPTKPQDDVFTVEIE